MVVEKSIISLLIVPELFFKMEIDQKEQALEQRNYQTIKMLGDYKCPTIAKQSFPSYTTSSLLYVNKACISDLNEKKTKGRVRVIFFKTGQTSLWSDQ